MQKEKLSLRENRLTIQMEQKLLFISSVDSTGDNKARIKYNFDEIKQLNHDSTCKIIRKVRKALFSLEIWSFKSAQNRSKMKARSRTANNKSQVVSKFIPSKYSYLKMKKITQALTNQNTENKCANKSLKEKEKTRPDMESTSRSLSRQLAALTTRLLPALLTSD